MAGPGGTVELISVQRIWDEAPHNAFTDLTRYQERWWCTFREGGAHASDWGNLRVIVSEDGESWDSAALVEMEGFDLRDPKLSVTPDGLLMLLAGARDWREDDRGPLTSNSWFSDDGHQWRGPWEIADGNVWLWRVTWHKGTGWGMGYGCGEGRFVTLYRSRCGRVFETVAPRAYDEGYPNETRLLFLDDDTALCLLRMDGEGATAQLGTATPPYEQWQWQDLGVKLGGPDMIQLPDGRFLAGGRLYDEPVRTSLLWLDPEQGTLTDILDLPSGGDTSYPGFVYHDGLVWMSYYSSHEERTSIYLARLRVD
ncbi:MAG: exo-alpha-sialidase [Armatimonadota bacterium]|nr:exo-alpha-sialidase [Armatimonadota bacterium]